MNLTSSFVAMGVVALATNTILGAETSSVAKIEMQDFSGSETVVAFAGDTTYGKSLTFDGVKITNTASDGLVYLQEGGQVPDVLFGNIPGASRGSVGRTTVVTLMQLLIELPSPARRFGMLISTGGPQTYTLTAVAGGVDLGSISATQPGSSKAVFAGIHSTTPFTQVRVQEVSPSGMTDAFDDLRFELTPEPASIALIGIGLTGVLMLRRCR